MKNLSLVLLASIFSPLSAHAASVLLYQTSPSIRITSAQYRISAELGRAWVVVHTWDWEQGSIPYGHPDAEVRAKVDGLSYDAATSSIVFAGSHGRVTCATVATRGHTLVISPGSACEFRDVIGSVTHDDGFDHVTTEKARQLYLDVREPAASESPQECPPGEILSCVEAGEYWCARYECVGVPN